MKKHLKKLKIIACIVLILAMLAVAIFPINISAAATQPWNNTYELFSEENNSLGAYLVKTAPKLDGNRDDCWDNALPLILNSATAGDISTSRIASSTDVEIYIIYDNDNLYIMEVNYTQSSSGTSFFNIVPTKNWVNDKELDGYMLRFIAASDGITSNTARRFYYQDNNLNANNAKKETGFAGGDRVAGGLEGFFKKDSDGTGYILEIKIPWTYLGCSHPTEFGFKFHDGYGYHIGGTVEYASWKYGGTLNWDCINHDPVELRTHKSVQKVNIDKDYWARKLSGTDTEFNIYTAKQLLSLSHYLAEQGDRPELTRNKTFILADNIDLNEGMRWLGYDPYLPLEEGGIAPTNKWMSLGHFYGTFDGQGYSVSGLWQIDIDGSDDMVKDTDAFGFVASLNGGCIKNLIIKNGYFSVAQDYQADALSLGALVGTVKDGDARIENVYVSSGFVVNGSKAKGSDAISAIIGSNAPNADGHTIILNSVVYAGQLTVPATQSACIGKFIAKSTNDKTSLEMSDCIFSGAISGDRAKDFEKLDLLGTINTATRKKYVRCYEDIEAIEKIDEADKMYLAFSSDYGTVPVIVGNMLSEMYFARSTEDPTTMCIISEVNSFRWDKVGYYLEFTRTKGGKTNYMIKDDTDNNKVYKSINVDGEDITESSSEFSGINGVALYAVQLKGIDENYTYEVKITPKWTYGDEVYVGVTRTLNLYSEQRVLLVTDIHYVPEYQRGTYDVDKDTRISRLVKHINDEHQKDPIDTIIFLGDYSLDFWEHKGADGTKGSWIDHGESYTKKFIDTYSPQLPDIPIYYIAGNHEQYNNQQWKSITGNDRETYFTLGDYLFILWDSYGAKLNPSSHSDGTYTPINVEAVRDVMDMYPDKHVILVSHWFEPNTSNAGESQLINDERVVCLFVGHKHHSNAENVYSKKRICCGNYSYSGDIQNYMWGFRDLYLTKDYVTTKYIVPENTIKLNGSDYKVSYRTQSEVTINVD